MKVICAGMPKTGTKSLHEALVILGLTVYDYSENMFYLGNEWRHIMDQGWEKEDFEEMYKDVDATCDLPAAYFWNEIHQAFPKAKVILTTRESEDEWLASLQKQLEILKSNKFLKIADFLSPTWKRIMTTQKSIDRVAFGLRLDSWGDGGINYDLLRKKYRQHNANVMQTVAQGQLLQYRLTEGWKPLCAFLDVPVPDQPFPHKNKGGDSLEENMDKDPMLLQIKNEIISSVCCLTAVLIAGSFLVFCCPSQVFDIFSLSCEYLPKYFNGSKYW